MIPRKLFVLLFFSLTLIQVLNYASALNVLVIVTLPLKSHYMAFERLFRELASRGHSVTVMNNYLEKNPPPNMTFVDLSLNRDRKKMMPPMSDYEPISSNYIHLINLYRHFVVTIPGTIEDCENLFINKNVRDFVAQKQKIDVIFVEQFMSDCGLAFAAALYDAPIIGITSHTLLPWAYYRLGIPFDFSADAFYFSRSGPNPSLYDKVEAYLADYYITYLAQRLVHDNVYKVFNKYLPDVPLDMQKVGKERMKMMFAYQHYSVTGARLLSPQVLEIGGIHIDKPKPIPQDLEKFLTSAKNGVIYVSFGSNLKASTMSAQKMQQFLDAFKRIPQKVLWKLENITLNEDYENILTRPWFPQRDILCHSKVLAFISHGGMLSLSEAAHCGKPLLAIPFFGDQFSNAAAIESSGLGTTLYFDHVSADSLKDSIEYLTTEKMQQSARSVSKLWHDRPMDVLDSAIYWTEYVARHRTAPPSLPSKSSTWFQRSLLDVYSVLFAVLLAVLILFYVVVKLFIYLVKKILGIFIVKKKKD
ncbi:unnamed protein product [Colias eurytheme]|nr:unnamed protein product [Colias eurytheme]